MKVDLIALKSFGRAKVGDRVSLPRQEAKILIATGHMQLAPAEVTQDAPQELPKRAYRRRDMTAESPVAVETENMQAEREFPVPALTTKNSED